MSVFIIAEAGVNHNGSIKLAKKLVDIAIKSGADAVKFQTFNSKSLVTKKAPKANYQIKNTNIKENQLAMLKRLELSKNDHYELFDYCKKKEIEFLSTPFDEESIFFLNNLGMKRFKIPSGEINNYPYLKTIGSLNKKIILSSGMASLGEVETALQVLIKSGTKKSNISVLHATTEYPTLMDDVNLMAMRTIASALKIDVGYSDHTIGIEVSIAASALGAKIIEKHFTSDKNLPGPDHKASLELQELSQLVNAIRNIEKAIGDGIKEPRQVELENLSLTRKSVVAKTFIKKGEKFSEKNITTKRPGTGISPMRWDEIIGQVATKNYSEDELL